MPSSNNNLSSQYNAQAIEEKIYHFWEAQDFFSCNDNESPSFCIMLPPPNVTGSLHLGHALDHTIQDVLIRWKRMNGINTLWQPGLDHAGIATQSVVEKHLQKQGIKKDISREDFLKHAWSWKEKYSQRIIHQMKKLGDSCDWKRNRFTLDKGFSQAVKKAFVHLYNEGFIYRGQRLVNWDLKLKSAVSDLEVEHQQQNGFLWYIKYVLEDQKEYLTIATTRPETLLGDTALAVHPQDERYKKYIGQKALHPILDRKIIILGDEFVDPEFGSGVVKITPAHDFKDYDVGKRHNLDFINILETNGLLNANAGLYQGLTLPQAREKILNDLTEKKMLIKQDSYQVTVPVSQRSGEIIEPLLSQQWFVKSSLMADKAKEVIETKAICFEPELWTSTYLHWMNHLQDWCISRQLWWGHQIPAWFCKDCDQISVSETHINKCQHCLSENINQEEDVLDTWFSSALWPFGTLGWPEQTPAFKTFYPTDVLVTGHDIIFFWVSRMVMAGLHHVQEIPFRKVYIHGIVRDNKGKKMSKSLGNTLDPIELIEKYGADALRLTLMSQVAGGRDLKFSTKNLESYRNFLNKLWNAARFTLSLLTNSSQKDLPDRPHTTTLPDRWIIYKLGLLESAVNTKLEHFKFSEVTLLLYDFVWHDFCDWYLELIKPIVYQKDNAQKADVLCVLLTVLNRICRLLHPLIPFVTEEIYQKLPIKNQACIIDSFPQVTSDRKFLSLGSKEDAFKMDFIKKIITAIRNIRGENNIPHHKKLKVELVTKNIQNKDMLEMHKSFILNLAGVEDCKITSDALDLSETAVALVQHGQSKIQVIVFLVGVVDFKEESKRLKKNINKIQMEIQKLKALLENSSFVDKAPQKVVEQSKKKLNDLEDKKNKLENNLLNLKV